METAIVVLTAILALTRDQEYQQQDPGVIVLPLILPLSNKHSDHIDDTDLLIMYINYRLWLTRIKRISCQLYMVKKVFVITLDMLSATQY